MEMAGNNSLLDRREILLEFKMIVFLKKIDKLDYLS